MPCLAASCAVVSSPRSASKATFALTSAEYRVRLPVIRVRPSRRRTELNRLSEIRGPSQPSPGWGDAAEPRADAADRRAVPGDALVRRAADGAAPAAGGDRGRAQAHPAADGEDGPGADLPTAVHDGAEPRAPGLSLLAAGSGDRPPEPGLVRRHHL